MLEGKGRHTVCKGHLAVFTVDLLIQIYGKAKRFGFIPFVASNCFADGQASSSTDGVVPHYNRCQAREEISQISVTQILLGATIQTIIIMLPTLANLQFLPPCRSYQSWKFVLNLFRLNQPIVEDWVVLLILQVYLILRGRRLLPLAPLSIGIVIGIGSPQLCLEVVQSGVDMVIRCKL